MRAVCVCVCMCDCLIVCRTDAAGFVHSGALRIRAPNPSELSGNSATLMKQLQVAFQIPALANVQAVLARHKYILTLDVRFPPALCNVLLFEF